MGKDDLTDEEVAGEEEQLDLTLRPKKLRDYIGQKKVKESLKVFIQAAKNRNESLEHILIYGPPGLGKTTLANIISSELNANIRCTSGPAIERAGDLASILTNLAENDVLFIDEIHRLNKNIEEVLYPAMEDFALDLIIGKGPSAKTLRLEIPKFTLIGATTRIGSISSPMRDRFGLIHHLDFYSVEEINDIIKRSAKILKIEIDENGVSEIASRSRGTPRIANRILKRVRDFAQVRGNGSIEKEISREALDLLEIDEKGLDRTDRNLLRTLIEKFKGGPVGLNTLAASISEETETIEDVYEPYLLQIGFIERTNRGRMATESAYRHFNFKKEVNRRLL